MSNGYVDKARVLGTDYDIHVPNGTIDRAMLDTDLQEKTDAVNDLKSAVGDLFVNHITVPYATKKYFSIGAKAIGSTIGDVLVGSNNWDCYLVQVSAGDRYKITGTGGSDPAVWALTDAGTTPSAENWADKGCKLLAKGGRNATLTDYIVIAEQDGWLLVNQKLADTFSLAGEVTVSNQMADLKNRILTLTDFGAVGDGVTDGTSAINAALVAAQGKTLYIPSGTYLFSGTLEVHSGTSIIGCGTSSVFKLADTFTLTPYEWRPEDGGLSTYKWPMMVIDDQANGCMLQNFVIEGQTSAFVDQAEIALTVRGSNHIIDNIVTKNINYFPSSFSGRQYNAPGEGIELFKAVNVVVTNCRCVNCGYEGIGTESTTDALIQNCVVGDTNQTGIQIHRSSERIKVIGCAVQYTADAIAGTACTLHANVGVDMSDIWITDNHFDKGVTLIGGAENYVHFCNNIVKSGALTRNGSIYRKNWVITGNQFLSGGIVNQIDNCIIADNFLTVNTGYQMINMRGNNVVANGNVALGSVSGVYIEPHE